MVQLKLFKNTNYPYKDADDTFIARGLHLNMLRNWVLSLFNGTPSDVPWGQTASITLGKSEDIEGAVINYKSVFPGSPGIGINYDEVGRIEVNNSSDHTENPQLHHTRTTTNHSQGSLTNTAIDVIKSGENLVMTVGNGTGYDMKFTYTLKILKT